MAVVIKNTFLDVASHKFLFFGEPCGSGRRCQSEPRKWKPVSGSSIQLRNIRTLSNEEASDSSTRASPRSNHSYHSAIESSVDPDTTPSSAFVPRCLSEGSVLKPRVKVLEHGASSLDDVCSCSNLDEEVIVSPALPCCFKTPSPRCLSLMGNSLGHSCFCQASGGNEMEMVLCSLSRCHCGLIAPVGDMASAASGMSASFNQWVTKAGEELHQNSEAKNEPETCTAYTISGRTKLKAEVPAFQPVSKESKLDPVANAAYLALSSCGQVHNVKLEPGPQGSDSILISAELQSGPRAASRCYDVMHITKQALDAVTASLPTTSLLSARVQKEERGYTLRSSIACVPADKESCMCWDQFQRGSCPRRRECRWYHPEKKDTGRIKISVTYEGEVPTVPREAKSRAKGSSAGKHTISSGAPVR